MRVQTARTSRAMPATAEEAFDKATALHGENRFDEAEALYRTALSHDPDHLGSMLQLATLHLQQKKPKECAELMRRAIELAPGSGEAHSTLGAALQLLGSPEDGLACQERALALAPGHADAHLRRAAALRALNRPEESVAAYEALLERRPQDDHVRAHLELGLGMTLAALDREGEAFVRFRNAASIDPALGENLTRALGAFAQRHPAEAQAGNLRLNRYVGSFLTNHASPRMGVYPGLTSAPFHDVSRFPGALALERNYPAVRAEIEALAAEDFQPEAENLKERGSWDVFLFYERGRRHEANCARCPVITGIIEASSTVRTTAGLLYVSKLSPGTHIKPHRGPVNLRLRCHLGVSVPAGDCGLKVGGKSRRWREGQCLVFDDSLEHEAWNRTAEPRIVLILDFWHPDLTPAEVAFLEGLHRFAGFQATSLNRYWSANEAARMKMD